ncbi:sulfotransferase, partial [Vibrio sp.]|nr:sulfotransferase [Vibrio sp.]
MTNQSNQIEKHPVVVLGMHRSGSSAITEFLTVHGLYFGSEKDGIGKNKENERGFWERRDVRDLNDEILQSLNCDWDTISSFDISKIDEETRKKFVLKAKLIHDKLICESTNGYVLKEPRVCLTYPIWEEAFDGNESVIVFIHRNPIEIALSLEKRNNYEQSFSLNLWYRYIISALNCVKNKRVLFISYDELSSNPTFVSQKLVQYLNEINIDIIEPSDSDISSVIQPNLRHQVVDTETLSGDLKLLNEHLNGLCTKGIVDSYAPISLNSELNDNYLEEKNINLNRYILFKN